MIIINKNINKYKNKGLELERLLINTFSQNKYREILLIEKYPTPIHVVNNNEEFISKAFFMRPSALDFAGIYKGKHIEIEAKTTQNPNIFSFNNILKHQYERIVKLINLGSLVYLVIEFRPQYEFYLLNGEDIIYFYNSPSKNINIEEIKHRSIKLSLNPNLTLDIVENI
jgi:recombination protein U